MPDGKIIIIDDEEGILALTKRLLERVNYSVESFSDPVLGIEAIQEHDFDLLLVDIRMPTLDGFEVIEQARKIQPELAVVIMTGHGTLETAIQALRKGANGLILKPFKNQQELIEAVNLALDERNQRQEIIRLRAIRPLLKIAEDFFSEVKIEELYKQIPEVIKSLLNCSHAAIYERSGRDSMNRCLASTGKRFPDEPSNSSGGLIARCEHWQVPIWINHDQSGNPEDQNEIEKQGFGAFACVPVKRNDRTLIFSAGKDIGEIGFNSVDIDLLGLLAQQAQVSLENASLYEDLREKMVQLEDSQLALIQAEKLSAVGRITASIAHEVNNPLQSMQNCLHLVGREDLEEIKREEYLGLAVEELDRLMSTVQRMLEYYRPGALSREAVQINEIVNKVYLLLENQISSLGIELHFDLGENLPSLDVVSNQIQQVIFNVMLNAMDTMPNGGDLFVKTYLNNGLILLDVLDSGPGISDEIANQVFEPFYSTRKSGTGLGLSISYGIITAHGGMIDFVDREQGACLRISLPIKEAG